MGGNCRTGTSTCDIGEVTVGQGPVLVLHLQYFLPHTKLELYKRKPTEEKERINAPCCIFGQRTERESQNGWWRDLCDIIHDKQFCFSDCFHQ